MKIAILGATSEISKDLISSFAIDGNYELALFARRPQAVQEWLTHMSFSRDYSIRDLESFSQDDNFDALINFVGAGNLNEASSMGGAIFDVTLKYDEIALGYIRKHPNCRYIFLSSGAAYGSIFKAPADIDTKALIDINSLKLQDWYGISKLYAECRHRSLAHLSIVDVRIFNYFSHTQNIDAQFLMADILRAIRDKTILKSSTDFIMRDYIGPEDFYQLIAKILNSDIKNDVVDCYSKAPIDKSTLLEMMKQKFGLQYELLPKKIGINGGDVRSHYFSLSRRANEFGYLPIRTSLENIEREINLGFKSSQNF